ncbi:hypothetical protein [Alkalicoccobacillus gibsonii]|uniref:hypothetical protein n=1 Tax=Alkalicoccobacillus gibsonii TaxID=79881 RepID=UPI0019332943|nr:hypothetical protein [Alkalicoccobacillus gibsonii]MBM0065464.1 hypothetical protein [Alkalicoccobacillus gibsonii]
MIKRKLIAALITIVISNLIISVTLPISTLLDGEGKFFEDLYISGFYILGVMLFYLLPLAFFIEWVTRRAGFARFAFAFYLYLFFGFIPIFIIFFLAFYVMLVFILFFTTDECLRWHLQRTQTRTPMID